MTIPSNPAPMKFRTIPIRDPAVQNIVGATILVPDGWRIEGGFFWMPEFTVQANLLLRISDPASGATLELLPAQQFAWPNQSVGVPIQPGSNWMGSVLLPPPRNPQELISGFYMPGPLAHLRSARNIGVQDLPQLAAEHARASGHSATISSNRLRFEFGHGGRPWHEDIYLTAAFPPPNMMLSMWSCHASAMRAPAGVLDEMTPYLFASLQSLRITLEWSAMLEHIKQMFRQGLREHQANIARIGQLWLQHHHQITQMHQQTWEERIASQDRQNFALREILGGVETHENPFDPSRAFELPQGFQDHWMNEQGEIIVSNDPLFDPRVGSTNDWRPMKRYAP